MSACPRCEGRLFHDGEDYHCIHCGWRQNEPSDTAIMLQRMKEDGIKEERVRLRGNGWE
jgi:tRNA(Ile2) C34 agmatinyltransferase TiaS